MIYNLDDNWLEIGLDVDSKEFIKNFLAKPKLFTNVEIVI